MQGLVIPWAAAVNKTPRPRYCDYLVLLESCHRLLRSHLWGITRLQRIPFQYPFHVLSNNLDNWPLPDRSPSSVNGTFVYLAHYGLASLLYLKTSNGLLWLPRRP